MKIVIAPDSFKGSLSAFEFISCVKQSASEHFEDAEIIEVPIADGGDGTVEVLVRATNGQIINTSARDPLGRQINCIYGSAASTAIIGMSESSGLALLKDDERAPLQTSTHGMGDIISHALERGFKDMLIGIGGSATNDGGTGAMQALGLKFFRSDGSEIARMCGKELIKIAAIDDSQLDARLKDARITIMCDVTNPLTGPDGATYVYGPQKGADAKQLESLEAGMRHYGDILNTYAGEDVSAMPGAGAAGGIGASLYAFLDAKLQRGIDAVLALVEFDKIVGDADLVITGEGRIDAQSASGKVIHGVAGYAKKTHVPVIALTGSIGKGSKAVFPLGVSAILALPDAPMSMEYCMQNAKMLLKDTADSAFSLIRIGCHIS